jgi:hypothetical protein
VSSIKRKLKRNKAKQEGTLLYKKALAKKFGCSVSELNERLKRREENLKKLEDKNDGNE